MTSVRLSSLAPGAPRPSPTAAAADEEEQESAQPMEQLARALVQCLLPYANALLALVFAAPSASSAVVAKGVLCVSAWCECSMVR